MTREDITRMAREAGFLVDEADFITAPKNGRIGFQTELERFVALVAEAERERMTVNFIHSCHPECDRPGCVAVRKAVEAEREACRQVCKALADAAQEEAYYRGHMECEAAIRARGSK
jgi:hypothetical protein